MVIEETGSPTSLSGRCVCAADFLLRGRKGSKHQKNNNNTNTALMS